MLGAATGSDSLRGWARHELNGYADDDELPGYRKLGSLPISFDYVSGPYRAQGQTISHPQLPEAAQTFIPETVVLRQPLDELEAWVQKGETLHLTGSAMPAAAAIWTRELGMFQEILRIYWTLPASTIAGIVGQIRNTLVDFVADLTADTPLTELPSREVVDAAFASKVMQVGDTYNTTVSSSSGPLAVGRGAKAKGMSIDDVLLLLGQVQAYAEPLDVSDREELLDAVNDLRDAVTKDDVDPTEIESRSKRLKALGERIGGGMLIAATSGAAEAAIGILGSGLIG